MKAYKFEVLVIDHDGVGPNELAQQLEICARVPIPPMVMGWESKEIGAWSDTHPLNPFNGPKAVEKEYDRLFDQDYGN